MNPTLTLVVIARNEARGWPAFSAGVSRLERHVSDLEKVVVIDSRTDDDTAECARRDGWTVLDAESTSLGEMKEQGRRAASGTWILNLDVDEVPTVDACVAIRMASLRPLTSAYLLDIRTFVGNQPLRVGPFAAERRLRLFPRECGTWSSQAVHEQVVTSLPRKPLPGTIAHHSFTDVEDYAQKQAAYAEVLRQKNPSKHGLERGARSVLRGVRYLLVYGGIKRGEFGFRVAWAQALYTWQKYA